MYDTTNEAVWSDIHDVSDEEWQSYQGKVDAIVGGSPCQAFSISGKRLGFNDPKGETFFQYVRALKNVKPSVFLFENVLGLLNHVTNSSLERVLPMLENDSAFVPNMAIGSLHYHNLSIYQENDLGKSVILDEYLKNPTVQKRLKKKKGRENYLEWTFHIVLQEFSKIGYDLEWEVLDSRDFGVPQRRERLYIIGHLRGEHTRKVFPFPESIRENLRLEQPKTSELSYTIHPVSSVGYVSKAQHGSRVKRHNEPMYTLTASGIHGILMVDSDKKIKLRKLTPREYWRCQGFSDELFDKAREVTSDSQLYHQAGNSVTVNVIQCIAYQLTHGEDFPYSISE